MPRLPRVHLAGILYYVTQQGAQDRPLFRDTEDYQTYLELLAQYKVKHEFKLFAYALNAEKIHLIVEPYGQTTISEIMRDLTSRYSKYCNGRYGGVGPLFKGRFHTIMAEKESLLIKLIHFVNSLSGTAVTTGVENSRDLFSTGRVEAVVPIKNSMKVEFSEIADRFQQMGFLGGLETLANPMSGEKMDAILKLLKDPVIGSADFVRRVRSQIADATERVHNENNGGNALAAGARYGVNISKWAFGGMAALVCAAIIFPVSYFMSSKNASQHILKPTESVVAQPASVQEKTAAVAKDRNTLHASVIVLEGTAWNLRLTPSGNQKKSEVEFDQISFANDQVISRKMAAKGFQPTYYTLTTNPDGSMVWETMQKGPNGERVFWRGEWKENGMSGVLSQQEVGGELKTFQFMGSQ